ncbi:fumarate hydratase, partial [bacterium]|nr:fumarate hydratase [bacterium]
MTEFNYRLVEETARELYIRALKKMPPDVTQAIRSASDHETNPTAKTVFRTILKNIELADTQNMILCQDTGLPVYFVKIGGRFLLD